MALKRDIRYLNRDFNSFRDALINYSKTYFPATYNDFNETSPGMLFIELASYVGDVLSFYLDNQIQESYLQYARRTDSLFDLAYMYGYKPKVTGVATAIIDIYQRVPAKLSGSTYIPDYDYALVFPENSSVQAGGQFSVSFLTQNTVDFSTSSSVDPTTVSVFSVDGSNNPTYFLLQKSTPAISAQINTTTFSYGNPTPYPTNILSAANIIKILDVTDSDNNEWYEVDYLAQDAIYDSIKNTNINDPNRSQYSDAPYLLKLRKVQRRFATRFLDSGSLQIQFGAGTAGDTDENLIPNLDNVGLGLPSQQTKLTTAFDPTNFVFTNTYGIAPSNTTLTVRYLAGGGVAANVPAGAITSLQTTPTFTKSGLVPALANEVFSSVVITNPTPATGGGSGDTIEELRNNSISTFSTQLRTVTKDDYLIRALSLPPMYGTIAQAYVQPTQVQDLSIGEIPSVLDLYVLGYDVNGKLAYSSDTVKNNLITYLSQYRMIGDTVRIKDGYIINIGVEFDIVILPDYVANEVLTECINQIQTTFDISKWQINQPIILRDLYTALDQVEGVQTVKTVNIVNKSQGNYSEFAYDIAGATINNVVYPSLDPSIFELKYPNEDIKGRVVPL